MASGRDGDGMIADRYELRSLIGRGGSGAVWHAYDTTLERPVAVKEVRFPSSVPDEERAVLRARFLREGRTAARLNHPNAITVYDTYEEDGRAFLVMELFECPTLDALVRAQGLYTPEAAAEVGIEILDALDAAHARGIVHRDVKPSNVLVGDTVKLTDFGIAYLLDDPSVTTTGSVVGSPSYMAPEQARDNTSSAASDRYCLGATLYYAVEGHPPFARGSAIATLTAVLNEPPPPPMHAGPLEPLILDLLGKEPSGRPSAEETRARLEDVAQGRATTTDRVPAAAAMRDPEPAPLRAPSPPPASATRSRRPTLTAVLAVLLVVLTAGAVAAALLREEPAGEVAGGNPQGGAGDAEEQPAEDVEGGQAENPEEPASDAGEPAPQPEAEPDGAADEPGGETEAGANPSGSVPDGWVVYTNPDLGYAVAHPDGWSVEPSGGAMIDIRDPDTPTYLRIDYTDAPPDDPVADWQRQSEAFGSRQDGYEELRIEATSFQGRDAALWEYRYAAGGANLRAYNLGIHYGDFGQALNFQTSEERWDDAQVLWEGFQRTFRPAGSA